MDPVMSSRFGALIRPQAKLPDNVESALKMKSPTTLITEYHNQKQDVALTPVTSEVGEPKKQSYCFSLKPRHSAAGLNPLLGLLHGKNLTSGLGNSLEAMLYENLSKNPLVKIFLELAYGQSPNNPSSHNTFFVVSPNDTPEVIGEKMAVALRGLNVIDTHSK
jgi:hypothetical protein